MSPRALALPALLGLALLATGCSSSGGFGVPEPAPATPITPLPEAVTHRSYHDLLARYVSRDGRVAYQEWAHRAPDVKALDDYIAELSGTTPDTDPTLFSSSRARLSYWINLYNALVLREMLRQWPLATIDDVRVAEPQFDVAGRGLLHDHIFPVGGKRMTLLDIERRIDDDKRDDARTYFAISCGARSCPLLPPHPFDARDLDAQLDDASRRFVNDEANCRVLEADERVELSAIFHWYKRDFERFVSGRTSHPAPSVVDFALLYAEPDLAKALQRARNENWEITFAAYDWGVTGELSAHETDPAHSTLAVGEPMPTYAFDLLDGGEWTIRDARGKVVLIDFWASFCRPCLASFPELEELQKELGDDLLIVAVAEDDTVAPVKAFVEAHDTTLLIALDPEHHAAEPPLSVDRLPTELLIDREGVIRARFEGLDDPPIARIAERARKLVGTRPAP